MSRKEIEEQKAREEAEAAASVYAEFVDTFQNSASSLHKTWVKAGTFDAGSKKEDTRDKGKLYKPTPKHGDDKSASSSSAPDYIKQLASESRRDSSPSMAKKRGAQEKKKSNLELFKEELRQMQEEREERHKYKNVARTMMQQTVIHQVLEHPEPIYREQFADTPGSFDNGDPNTTNLYLGNLNPKITEQQLMELFGKYGALASVKIMWPRSEEEKNRGRNCGFVAFMSRKDAERALRSLTGQDVMGYEMKLGWGKAVPIMAVPLYVPPKLQKFTSAPENSGLPFNAQLVGEHTVKVEDLDFKNYIDDEDEQKRIDETLVNSMVKVVIPAERQIIAVIHRMIEFVIREGPMFEALIMNREVNNPSYKFLYDNEHPWHIYYRWKLFSMLQGDTQNEWREKEFRMFKRGSIWKPPQMNFYSQGMPEELLSEDDMDEPNKGQLSIAQRNRLEDLIRHLTPDRSKIADTMIFCIEHADAADEICECIAESLSSVETAIHKKIARIYLVSDILHNCTVKVQNASFFRKAMERNLETMFRGLNESYKAQESRLKAEGFKVRIMKIFRTWEEWTVYNRDFLLRLQNTFLGLITKESKKDDEQNIDGVHISDREDEDLDGVPLDGAALLKGALMRGIPTPDRDDHSEDDDIDGIPLDDNIDGAPIEDKHQQKSSTGGSFVKSKWEELDPEQVEKQAITTSKWELLQEPTAPEPPKISGICNYDDSSGSEDEDNSRDNLEEKRKRLREVEVRVLEYQEDLENGHEKVKSGWSVKEQVEHYRKKLLKRIDKNDSDSQSERYGSSSSSRRDRDSSERRMSKKSKHRSSSEERERYRRTRNSRSTSRSK